MNNSFDKEIRFKLLFLLKEEPKLTQREMNQKMGVSLGKVNYCVAALVKKGMIKVEQFKNHKNKTAYIYRLTPKGLESMSLMAVCFLKSKIKEYDGIKKQIIFLSEQINKIDPELHDDPKLIDNLKKII